VCRIFKNDFKFLKRVRRGAYAIDVGALEKALREVE
jgi:hypothetical protein